MTVSSLQKRRGKLNNLDSSIEKLLNSRPVYNEPLPQMNEGGFMQKMGKKFVSEEDIQRNKALNDFGYNQNSLNIDFIRAFLDLQDTCKELQKQIEDNEADYRKAMSAVNVLKKELDNVRLRSTLNSNQIEKMDAGLYKYTEKLENYTLSINPSVRNDDCPKGCIETDISGAIGYYDRIEKAKDTAETDELEKFCASAIAKNITSISAYDELVIDFYGSDKISAVLFTNLNKNSVYKIRFLKDRDIPSGHFSVICSENIFVPRKLMLKSTVVVVTGDSPFEELNEEDVRNLKFLNDCGLHTYITLENAAYEELVSHGFRCVSRMSLKQLAGGKVIRYAEKALESAVPAGAVSFNTLRNMIEDFDDYYLTDPADTEAYAKERQKVYPYDCLMVMERAAASAIKNKYFPTGVVTGCRLSKAESGSYTFIDGMNYLNHLTYDLRVKIYEKVRGMLQPEGIFMVNGYDPVVGIKVRSIKGWDYFPNYEAMWTRDQLIRELKDNGFKIKFIIPTGAGLFDVLPQKYRKDPAEWIIAATI